MSKLQQGLFSRRNRAEVETILEHDIKLHSILNKYLEQNGGGGAVYPSNIKYGRISERLQLSHPGNAQTKETKGLNNQLYLHILHTA